MVWLNRTPFDLITDFDRLATAALARSTGSRGWQAASAFSLDAPRANLHFGEDEVGLELLVPGYGPEHIEATVEGRRVSVKGERRSAAKEGAEGELLARFERRFELPFEVESEAVQARLEHGVLRLALPRSGKAAARVIPINV